MSPFVERLLKLLEILQWISVAWPLVTGIINTLVYFDTPEAWQAFQVTHPRCARLLRLCRALGLHTRKGYDLLKPPRKP